MGPWLLPPHSANVCGLGHDSPSRGVKEGCDSPMLVLGSHKQEGAQRKELFPSHCPAGCLGKALPGSLGWCSLWGHSAHLLCRD